jgi:uncharacterized protein DUF6459
MANTTGDTLQRLRPYEPHRERSGPLGTGGQLLLDVPPPIPETPGTGPGAPPIQLRQIRTVINLILEVRTGHRPARQLSALVHPRLLRLLGEQIQTSATRYTLKTVRAARVAPDAVEASGTAHSQGRAYAVVARFERAPQGWRCTFFELIRPTPARRVRSTP